MPDVRIRQQEITIAQHGLAAAFLRATAHGDVFAENISVSYNQFSAFTAKGIILRVAANRTERIKQIVLAEP